MPSETVPRPSSGPLVLGLGLLHAVALTLQNDMRRRGMRADVLVLRDDPNSDAALVRALQSAAWSGVVVGAGVSGMGPRAPPRTPEGEAFFQRVQQLIAQHAPRALVAYPSGPADIYAAMARAGLPPPPISEADAAAAAAAAAAAPRGSSAAAGDAKDALPSSAVAWYASHRANYTPLSFMQRGLLLAGSAALAALNPHRGDLVAAVGELADSAHQLQYLLGRLRASDEGRWLLHHKPRWISGALPDSLAHMRAHYPSNSLGARYANFMLSHGYTPEGRSLVRFVEDPEQAYALQRYRDVHDLLHVLTDLPTSVLGELAQKAFEAQHFGLQMPKLAAQVAPALTLSVEERKFYDDVLRPWSTRLQESLSQPGRPHLLAMRYEQYLRHDVDELRREWGIIPAPHFPPQMMRH